MPAGGADRRVLIIGAGRMGRGVGLALAREGVEVRLFSRDLHDVSGQFPEVVAAAAGLPWDGILDGEILAYREGSILPRLPRPCAR